MTENNLVALGAPKLAIVPSPQALSDAAWKALLEYARAGGVLLITGSPERDDRWRKTQRLRDLGIAADAAPLTFRAATMNAGRSQIAALFAGNRQLTLESLNLPDGWAERKVGQGTMLVAAYPVELAESADATRAVYQIALERAGVGPSFTGMVPAGVLVRPTVFADSVLYLLESEAAASADLDLKDTASGAPLRLHLPAQGAALVLLDRRTGAVLAKCD